MVTVDNSKCNAPINEVEFQVTQKVRIGPNDKSDVTMEDEFDILEN